MNAKRAFLSIAILLASSIAGAFLTISGCSQNSTDEPQAVDFSGPLPKIACDEPTYNFGMMAAGTKKEHQFVIRNDGEKPLEIKDLGLGCKCTKGTVKQKYLKPGESTTVDVTWEPERKDPGFQQILKLETNDPRYADPNRFKLIIRGAVEQTLDIDPFKEFKSIQLAEDEPTVIHGVISSRLLDKFSILSITAENKLISGVATSLDKAALEKLKAKCGYDVAVTIAPGMTIGTFTEKVNVKTDIEGGTEVVWLVNGERAGPFRFVAGQGAKEWSSTNMQLKLGQFKASDGRKAQLRLLVNGPGNDLEFRDIKSDVAFVKLGMKPDPANASRETKIYWLSFEVAPGSPPATFNGPSVVKIHVTTNHPKAEHVEFKVSFIST
nr:hypothetical protein [uncultured bacterium]